MLARGGLAASILSWALNPYAHLPAGIVPSSHAAAQAADEAAEVDETDATDATEPVGGDATHAHKTLEPSFASAPAMRYGSMDRAACERELRRRGVRFQRVDETRGVIEPIRLAGPLHGVTFHSALSPRQRATSIYEIVDCRLALALDDFAAILERHDVVEVIHLSAYRPPSKRRWVPGSQGKRHGGALAMDMGTFKRKDGTSLSVLHDFHGRIGARTCGPKSGPWPATPEALTLRQIFCEAVDAHVFNVALSPDFNRKHDNHFHLEVSPRAKWFYVR